MVKFQDQVTKTILINVCHLSQEGCTLSLASIGHGVSVYNIHVYFPET